MSFLTKIRNVVQQEGARGIRQVLQKEGTKRFAQDLSAKITPESFHFCETRRYGLPSLVSAIAVDPVQGLLAAGTYKGVIAVTGAFEAACYLELEEGVAIKSMTFQPGFPVLVVVDARNAITVFDLIKQQRLFVRNARSIITCMELLPGSNWLFHGLKDGTIDVFDVYRGQAVPYRIPNILPEGPTKHSMVISIQAHPRDNNQLLIAYNTGIVLWNLQQKSVIRTFIYEIPPGAVGGYSPDETAAQQPRYPHVTVVSWRPDGLGFVSGYDDGCIVFWDIRQERPITARTIHETQVNVPGVRSLTPSSTITQFVPIYQLAWCLHQNQQSSTLVVAGGNSEMDLFGLHLFEYGANPDLRHPPKRQQTLPMDSDIMQFVVLPRESPWFNGGFDPIAIIAVTNRGGIISHGFEMPYPLLQSPACLQWLEPKVTHTKMVGPLPQHFYQRLVYGADPKKAQMFHGQRLPLRGGQPSLLDESRLSKDILITVHADASVRFWDGARLLPLTHLNADLAPLFHKHQAQITAIEFSVGQQAFACGFANGQWVYCQIQDANAIARRDTFYAGQTTLASSSPTSPSSSSSSSSPEGHPSQLPGSPQDTSLPPNDANVSVEAELGELHLDDNGAQSPSQPLSPASDATHHENTASGRLLANLQQEVSPALPPRPLIQEVSLPRPTETQAIFKSSVHLGRINHIAMSDCGLVAVVDEFYTISITDTKTRQVVHIEDLKVVTWNESANASEASGAGPSPVSPQQHGQEPPSVVEQRLVGVQITSLRFVIATTSDQDKTPGLQLVAGSHEGVYIIFSISATTATSSPATTTTPAQAASHGVSAADPAPVMHIVRKIDKFQIKEKAHAVHCALIHVLAPEEGECEQASSQPPTLPEHPLPPPPPPPLPAKDNPTEQISSGRNSLSISDAASVLSHETASSAASRKTTSTTATSSSTFMASLKEAQDKMKSKAHERLAYFVCVTERGVRLHMNCTSRRIHKVEMVQDSEDAVTTLLHQQHPQQQQQQQSLSSSPPPAAYQPKIVAAGVISYEGSVAILCLGDLGQIQVYSVPKLELISPKNLRLPILTDEARERLGESIILGDGRLLVPILKFEYRVYSLFGDDRVRLSPTGEPGPGNPNRAPASKYHPQMPPKLVELYDHSIHIPPRPTPLQAKSGWFGLGSSTDEAPSQEDLDALLGGEHYRAENPMLKRAGVKGSPGTRQPAEAAQSSSSPSGVAGMMDQTIQALGERGEKLDQLGDKTAQMSAASEGFLKAARELNAKNANKKWYEF